MTAAGFSFYLADNGVWLTESVPPQHIAFPEEPKPNGKPSRITTDTETV